jgi:hypothetical protein
MIIKVFEDKLSLGWAAAHKAGDAIRQAIQTKGRRILKQRSRT